MQDYDDELTPYEHEAEDHFDDFYSGLEGNDEVYYDPEEYEYIPAHDNYYPGEYDSYRPNTIGRIDPNDRTLTVVIANDSQVEAEAIVFGANQEADQVSGVSVNVEESSHKEVREESKAHPFRIAGMKMSVSDPLQFDNVLQITRKTATGSLTSRVYQPRNATSPQNFTSQLIDDDNFEMDVTGQDSLRFVIRAGATVVFTFTVKARANMGNLLKGNNVAELSTIPRTTGLPQLDLLRKSRPSAFGLKAGGAVPRRFKRKRRKRLLRPRQK